VLKLIVVFIILLLLIGFGILGIVLRGLLGILFWLRGGQAGDEAASSGRPRPGIGPRSGGGRRTGAPERMVACVVCGVHVPESEAVRAADEIFCCDEHRRIHSHSRGSGQ
jgi:uncharacterized protein